MRSVNRRDGGTKIPPEFKDVLDYVLKSFKYKKVSYYKNGSKLLLLRELNDS